MSAAKTVFSFSGGLLTLRGDDGVAVYDASGSEWAADPAMAMERD